MDGFKNKYEQFFDFFKTETCIDSQTICSNDENDDNTDDLKKPEIYNFSFDEFLKCFKKIKFEYVILSIHKQNTKIVKEFLDEAAEFITSKMSPENSIETRIFAFYILYTMWTIMNKAYVPFKIRVNQKLLSQIRDLVTDSLERKQFDISIAYRKLVSSGAFAYCQSVSLLGPYYKDYIYKFNNLDFSKAELNFYTDIEQNIDIYESLLGNLQNIEYVSIKQYLEDIKR